MSVTVFALIISLNGINMGKGGKGSKKYLCLCNIGWMSFMPVKFLFYKHNIYITLVLMQDRKPTTLSLCKFWKKHRRKSYEPLAPGARVAQIPIRGSISSTDPCFLPSVRWIQFIVSNLGIYINSLEGHCHHYVRAPLDLQCLFPQPPWEAERAVMPKLASPGSSGRAVAKQG